MPGLSDSYCSSSTRTLPAISCLSSAKSLITFIPLAGGHSSAPLSGILASCLACVYQYERYAKPSQAESISCLSLWIEVLVYKSTAWLRFGQGKWRTRPLQSSTLNDSCSSLCGQTVATLFSLCHCLPPWTTLFGVDCQPPDEEETAGQYFCCQQTFAFHFSTSKNIFTAKHTHKHTRRQQTRIGVVVGEWALHK